MNRWIAIAAAMLVFGLVAAGCGSSSSDGTGSESATSESTEAAETNGGGSKAGDSDISVSYISPVAAQPGQQQVNYGLEKGAEELGWSETVLDSNLSPDKQVSNVETAITRGDAAIASWTLDPNAAAGAYEQAQAAGIPVIGVNSKGPGLTTTIWWENQRCEKGNPQAVSAEKIAEIYPHAKTIMVGDHIAESTREYSTCFMREAKRVGLDVLDEAVTEIGNTSDAQKVFEPLLTKYPDVEAVWAFNDESALGVSIALQAAGKQIATIDNPEGVIVSGQNGDKAAIEAVEEGRLSWTWDQNNTATGFACILAMKEALEGKTPQKMIIEAEMFDSENVGEYKPPEDRGYSLKKLPLK